MITSEEFLASEQAKKLPDWIKLHPSWKSHSTINKVFPSLGLSNCREPCSTELMDLGPDSGIPTLKKMDICFSSDGIEGMWDISTMSMRGVLSCRHWENQHAKASYNIVADMANPNLGIIYLTDGTMTEYGLSMIKRCLVRYEPGAGMGPVRLSPSYIYLDKVHAKTTNRDPFQYLNNDPDSSNIKEILKNFLKSKLNNKAKANTAVR